MGNIFHEMTNEEIAQGLDSSKSEIRELRFTYAVSRSLQDPSRIGNLKRNIARMNTVLRERELGLATIKPKTERKKKEKSKESGKSKN